MIGEPRLCANPACGKWFTPPTPSSRLKYHDGAAGVCRQTVSRSRRVASIPEHEPRVVEQVRARGLPWYDAILATRFPDEWRTYLLHNVAAKEDRLRVAA
jgi:hypothetical protein